MGAAPPDLCGERGSDFAVQVALDLSWSQADHNPRPTWVQFEDKTADSVAWVLQQLIDYPPIVDIDREGEEAEQTIVYSARS